MSRLTLSQNRNAYPWSIELQTRFGDLDVQAHLNNVSIARLFEETRVRHNHHLKTLIPGFNPFQFVMARLTIDFLAEGQYPAAVSIGQAITHIGNTSLVAGAAMFQGDKCLALCESVLVHRTETGSTPLPQALRDRLADMTLRTEMTGETK